MSKILSKGDFFGGLTAAVVALPLALAFGVASGAGALAGLYGAILVGFFAAIFGGTASQISGPTGPMTVIMTVIVAHFSASPATAFVVVLCSGILQIAFGFLGIGQLIKLVPYPVVSGFMTGIGCIIVILQIPAFLGHSSSGDGIVATLFSISEIAATPSSQAIILGLLALLISFFTPKFICRFCPSLLIALFVGTLFAYFLTPGVEVIGAIPSGLPSLSMPEVVRGDILIIFKFALILALLGSIDSLLTSLVADEMMGTKHDSNKELVGQGIGNMFAGLVGGLPGAGATMRTVTNIRSGGTSRASGALHAIVLLAIMLGFGGIVAYVPLAVLAGILFNVGINIVDWKFIARIHVVRKASLLIMLSTLLVTIFIDLITAVALGCCLTSIFFYGRGAKGKKLYKDYSEFIESLK